jgi:uncharacterized protein
LPRRTLLDLNVLIALTDYGHKHHEAAWQWFTSGGGDDWGICPLTESGFIRLMSSAAVRAETRARDQGAAIRQSVALLQYLSAYPGFHYWEITERESWVHVTAPLADRVTGHQQITDAYLLGLAIAKNGLLVTFDRGIRYLAGEKFADNLLVLNA